MEHGTFVGTISQVVFGKGFGFVKGNDDVERFFTYATLPYALPFEALKAGDRVTYDIEPNHGRGPRCRIKSVLVPADGR